MLIMALAHARATGNGTLLSEYVRDLAHHSLPRLKSAQYPLLHSWAEYLVENSVPLHVTE